MHSHGSETVAGFGSGIAEAAVLADEVDSVLLILGARDMVIFPARLGSVLEQPGPGRRVDWATGGSPRWPAMQVSATCTGRKSRLSRTSSRPRPAWLASDCYLV